jgi:hypothetical protein
MRVVLAALRLDVTAVDHERPVRLGHSATRQTLGAVALRAFVCDAEQVRVSRYRLGTDAV